MTDTPPTDPQDKPKAGRTAVPEPTEPAQSPTDDVIMRNPETGGITTVRRSAFENSWRYKGWEEVDPDAQRAELYAEAKARDINVAEDADGRSIVEAIISHERNSKEV